MFQGHAFVLSLKIATYYMGIFLAIAVISKPEAGVTYGELCRSRNLILFGVAQMLTRLVGIWLSCLQSSQAFPNLRIFSAA